MANRFWVQGAGTLGGPGLYQPSPGLFPLTRLDGTSNVDATILRIIVDTSVYLSYNDDSRGAPALGSWWYGLQPTVAAGVMTEGGLDYPDAYSDTEPTPTLTGTLTPKYYETTWPSPAYNCVYSCPRLDSKGERKSPTPGQAPAAGLSMRFLDLTAINGGEEYLDPGWTMSWYIRALFSDPS